MKLSVYSKIQRLLAQGFATAGACTRQVLHGGLPRTMAGNLVRLAQFIVFVLLWKGFAAAGADLGGMTGHQLLTYTLLSFAVRPMLDILSPATSCLWEGSIVGRYTRPMPVYLSFISETIGRFWLPWLVFFALPVLLVSPLIGISPAPATPLRGCLFVLSMLLSIIIGFGIDLLFSAFAIRLRNAMWMATRIREAIYSLLSGALIPFSLFPGPVATVLRLLPFGSIANAPLTIYVGLGHPWQLLALQAFWAVIIWPIAHLTYKKSEERMVSYGG